MYRDLQLTNSSSQMVTVESLDVLDFEGVEVDVVETEKSESVLIVSSATPRSSGCKLTLTSKPRA
jgi:hypothetical protein